MQVASIIWFFREKESILELERNSCLDLSLTNILLNMFFWVGTVNIKLDHSVNIKLACLLASYSLLTGYVDEVNSRLDIQSWIWSRSE